MKLKVFLQILYARIKPSMSKFCLSMKKARNPHIYASPSLIVCVNILYSQEIVCFSMHFSIEFQFYSSKFVSTQASLLRAALAKIAILHSSISALCQSE